MLKENADKLDEKEGKKVDASAKVRIHIISMFLYKKKILSI